MSESFDGDDKTVDRPSGEPAAGQHSAVDCGAGISADHAPVTQPAAVLQSRVASCENAEDTSKNDCKDTCSSIEIDTDSAPSHTLLPPRLSSLSDPDLSSTTVSQRKDLLSSSPTVVTASSSSFHTIGSTPTAALSTHSFPTKSSPSVCSVKSFSSTSSIISSMNTSHVTASTSSSALLSSSIPTAVSLISSSVVTSSLVPAASCRSTATPTALVSTNSSSTHSSLSNRLSSAVSSIAASSQCRSLSPSATSVSAACSAARRISSRPIKRKRWFDDELTGVGWADCAESDSAEAAAAAVAVAPVPVRQHDSVHDGYFLPLVVSGVGHAVPTPAAAPRGRRRGRPPRSRPVTQIAAAATTAAAAATPAVDSASVLDGRVPAATSLRPATDTIGHWKASDDLALLLSVQRLCSLSLVHLAVRFSCRFSGADIARRWHALLYDRRVSQLALSAIRQLPAAVVDAVEERLVYSDAEEQLVASVGSAGRPPSLQQLEQLLTANVHVFDRSRTVDRLLRHWHLLDQYQMLAVHGVLRDSSSNNNNSNSGSNNSNSVGMLDDRLPLDFSTAEEMVDEEVFDEVVAARARPSSAALPAAAAGGSVGGGSRDDEAVDNDSDDDYDGERQLERQEQCLSDHLQQKRVDQLLAESRTWQVLVEHVSGAAVHFDNSTLAVLRGRTVRYLMRSAEVVLGRSSSGGHPSDTASGQTVGDAAASRAPTVDIDLSLEGPAGRVSRCQAVIRLLGSGQFLLANVGRRAVYVDGVCVEREQRCQLHDTCQLQVAGLTLTFLVHHRLVNTVRAKCSAGAAAAGGGGAGGGAGRGVARGGGCDRKSDAVLRITRSDT